MKCRIVAAVVSIGALSACADLAWVKEGATPEEFRRDANQCQAGAQIEAMATYGYMNAGYAVPSMTNRCMETLGYTRTAVPSGSSAISSRDPALEVVNCKFPDVEGIHRKAARSCTNNGGTILR